MPDVNWSAEWECGDCGARGDALFPDGEWVESDHECEDDDV